MAEKLVGASERQPDPPGERPRRGVAPRYQDELDGVDCVVADLDAVAPERLSDLGLPVIGFYQHTDVETKRRADAAGLALAVPRSRMVRELPELVEGVLG